MTGEAETVEIRELAYFVAVAEELHFGRAARRLGIAQPPLSRAIKQLEHRVGGPLLERTTREVVLTPAGAVLLGEARKALDAAAAAMRRTRRAAHSGQRLVVALYASADSGMLSEILADYQARPGAIEVDVRVCGLAEAPAMLRDGSVDVAFLHSSATDLSGLDIEPILTERRIAVLSSTHRLAQRDHLSLAELRDEPMASWTVLQPDQTVGPNVRNNLANLIQLIALGSLVAVPKASVGLYAPKSLACVPVPDAPPATLTLGWQQDVRSPAVASFVRSATSIAASHQQRINKHPYEAVEKRSG